MDAALSISTDLGMSPLRERVAGRLHRLDARPAGVPAYPDDLTEGEVEVLWLIAQGQSNRELGEELFIAQGTVRRHISSIYEKIGATNRAEATRCVLDQGFT